jgi:hypothetical protein
MFDSEAKKAAAWEPAARCTERATYFASLYERSRPWFFADSILTRGFALHPEQRVS